MKTKLKVNAKGNKHQAKTLIALSSLRSIIYCVGELKKMIVKEIPKYKSVKKTTLRQKIL